jgi:transcriptional regulator with XRE-family HTH domain
MTNTSRWPAIVADLMTEQGLSQKELAHRTGIARSTIGRFLRREGSIGIGQLEHMLSVLGCDLEALPIRTKGAA